MVVLQTLNRIIKNSDINIVIENNLTKEMFIEYENEFEYIWKFYNQYGKVPDKETFLSNFPEFNLIEVNETDNYLVNTLNEEYLYFKTVPVVQQVAELLKSNSDEAVNYLLKEIPNLTSLQKTSGTDIIQNSEMRLQEYQNKLNGDSNSYITTGFEELDDIFKGFAKGEELVVLFARIGQGKSWILNKMLAHSWQIGYNVGLISPEMSANKIGYRFDTLTEHFSNKNLVWGKEEDGYIDYLQNLKNKTNKYIVTIPQDFNKKITVSKIKSFCQKTKIDILGIDGITYLTDERYKKGDNRTTMLTNISEDLMSLSIELKIPILVVVQSNRGGINKENENETPDLENIKDSDGIAANATKVLAIKQKTSDNVLQLTVRKHRDGKTGQTLLYQFDFDKGIFNYIPSENDGATNERRSEKVAQLKKEYSDEEDVF